MRALGTYLLRSPVHAIGAVSLMAIFSFYLSSVMVAMLVMRKGGVYGLQVIAGSLVVCTLIMMVIFSLPVQDLLLIAVRAWLPVWCCAMALRYSESQAVMVLVAGLFGSLFIVLIYLLVDDVPLWWQTWFNDLMDALARDNPASEAVDAVEQLKAGMEMIAPMINPFIVAFLVIRLVTIVLAGRWWQSLLFNPGAFKREFYGLRLPRSLLYLVLPCALVLLWQPGQDSDLVRDLLWLVIVLYLFQGIACVHRLVNRRNLSVAWLVTMYSLLVVLFPHMLVLIACIGMADSWSGARKIPG